MRKNPRDGAWPSFHPRPLPAAAHIRAHLARQQTSSGRLVGKIQTDAEGRPFFKPHIELISYDYLRVGYEDENWHSTLPVTRRTPKAGTFTLRLPCHKTPKAGTPVFLIDRREPELVQLIAEWKRKLDRCKGSEPTAVEFTPKMPKPAHPRRRPDMTLRASLPYGSETRRSRNSVIGLWLSPKSVREVSRTVAPNMAWWLPPVIWPDEEELWKRIINEAIRNGAKAFCLQRAVAGRVLQGPRSGSGRRAVL